MGLPRNGDAVIKSCFNCDSEFEEVKKLNEWIECKKDEGGCGFHFMLRAKSAKLETTADE